MLLEQCLHHKLVCLSPCGVVGQPVIGVSGTLGSDSGASPGNEAWQGMRATLACIMADGSVLPELSNAALAACFCMQRAAHGPDATVTSGLCALRLAQGHSAKAAVANALLRAGSRLGTCGGSSNVSIHPHHPSYVHDVVLPSPPLHMRWCALGCNFGSWALKQQV